MNRRRIVAIAMALLAPAILLFGACSFPEVNFGPGGSEGGSESPTNESSTEAGSEAAIDADTDASDALIVSDVDISEVATFDSASVVDANSCDAKPVPCDCDDDGYLAIGCDASAMDAAGKEAGDCNDTNGFIHPNQIFSDSVPSDPGPGPGKGGDWNCSGVVEKGISEGAWCKGSAITPCTSGVGFAQPVACGVFGELNTCIKDSLPSTGCHQALDQLKKQLCK